ncbi:MAG: alkaline phosphatase [Acidobacteria bacterium]|nr:alkaline phosphatase [Acidobacteriota bacterium]
MSRLPRNDDRGPGALRVTLPCLLVALALAVSFAGAAERKNFIFMVGDGMGFDAVAHAHFHRFGMHPADEDHRLTFEKWKVTGYLYTQAGSSLVTDSAAAASALYTGKKHRRGALCVDDRNVPIPSLFELAHRAGYSVGVVTSVPITDATPAATFAHVPHREEFPDIYRQLLASRYEVFLGAGANGDMQYLPKDFEKLAQEAGYHLARDAGDLKRAAKLPLLGVFGDVTLPYEYDRLANPSDAPRLADLVEKALQLLESDTDGFVLLVEGGAIDWAAHAGNLKREIHEVLGFEAAVKVVEKWVEKNSSWDETLVVVTADHETGELTVRNPEDSAQVEFRRETSRIRPGEYSGASYGSSEHSAGVVPLYARGRNSGSFAGVHDNTGLFGFICDLLGLQTEK